MSTAPITIDHLQARADLVGVSLDPEHLPQLAQLMENTLAPLRALDPERLRSVEPMITCVVPQE